ncbi:purine-cytosine permease family protein [Streptomyces sp. NPDC057939]|uniref:purine-cytosine permease family protein n=1 Tax=Streptomyces sp. NPDC057939 TaxID=3346284 RepID=UPI0036E2D06C
MGHRPPGRRPIGRRLADAVETRGLEPVPDEERTARIRGLFPTWMAGNTSVLLLAMGAGLTVAGHLSLAQVLIVAVVAPVVSYGIVGIVSVAGRRGGAPGLALARAVFGTRGNLLPGTVIWVARWGWETINAVTGAYALLTVLRLVTGVGESTALIVAALALFVTGSFVVSGLGRSALLRAGLWAACLFGGFSVLVIARVAATTDWSAVWHRSGGSTAVLVAGIGTIAAGGISWVPSAPDFTRYLPRTASATAMVATTVAGAGLVVTPLVIVGAVLAVGNPGLAAAPDPVAFIGGLLPVWLAVPYLLTAVAGMVLINAMSMYSAGFTAQTLGVRLPRVWAVSLNAAVSLVLGTLIMAVARSFQSTFVSFLTLLSVAFSAWTGVFVADMLRRRAYDPAGLLDVRPTGPYWYRAGFSPGRIAAWALAVGTGLLFTRVAWFDGPLASTWPGRYGLGWVAGIAVGALLGRATHPRSP